MTDDTNMTVRGYLRSKGLDDEEIAALAPEVEAKVRELYIERYGTEPPAANVSELDDYRDHEDDGEQAREPFPVILGGSLLRCGRCSRSFTAETWHCVEWVGPNTYREICRRCADLDPTLGHWQEFCDVTDMIDALMRTAPDKQARAHLRSMLVNAAGHFEVWRWPEENTEEAL